MQRSEVRTVARFGVHIHSGASARLTHSDFASSRGSAIVLEGPDASVQLGDCTVNDSAGHGIEVIHSSPVIERCSVRGCENSGIAVSGPAAMPTVQDCEISGVKGHGIQVIDGAGGRYLGNSVKSVGQHGIAVGERNASGNRR